MLATLAAWFVVGSVSETLLVPSRPAPPAPPALAAPAALAAPPAPAALAAPAAPSPSDAKATEASEDSRTPQGPTGLLATPPATPAGEDAAGSASARSEFPWKLDRAHKYLWISKGEKIGETTFQFRRERGPDGPEYVVSTRRRIESGGRSQESEGSLRFRPDGRPLSFQEETEFTMGAAQAFSGHQEVRIEFEKDRAIATYVNNGRAESASRHEVRLEQPTFLFSTYCQEQWNLFSRGLARPTAAKLAILYPEFGQVLTVEFTPRAGGEMVELGGKKVEATRYAFECKLWKWKGNIWVDGRGRMLRYECDDLRIVLATSPE
jgi:hypothetical protein